MQSCHLMSVRQDSTLLGWFLFVCCCSCYCSMFSFSLLLSFALFLAAFWYHLPLPLPLPQTAFLLPISMLWLSFWSLYSLFLISLVVAASELTECLCHAVCLKPWFYCCRTKLNLMWLLGCYLQFISLSAALVKRTLSRYFFFIIFQIIFFTVYNNPLKAWNLNLSLPRSFPSYIHTGLLL